jgi:hypothetical protein
VPIKQTFGRDVDFLKRHTELIVLTGKSGAAQVAVAPAWQGRVMTSTANGPRGTSFGWVNHELIGAKRIQAHINPYGGEDRFWLGPEGGQFSIFFAPGAPFDLEHWFTPRPLDTEAFQVIKRSCRRVHFQHVMEVANHSGTKFKLLVDREVRLLDAAKVLRKLRVKLPRGVKSVAFESVNTVKNIGSRAWTKKSGLLSIWMLGMFNASPKATILVPYRQGSEAKLGPMVNDTYFGKVPADRLVVREGVIFFRADANFRGKIGLTRTRARALLGSYDARARALTIVQFTLPRGAKDYVNSMWEMQKQPFAGDAVNGYNDGPPAPGGKQLGRFFELESSSPALALRPGASATHRHQTIHLQGGKELDKIAQAAFGVTLREIKGVFVSENIMRRAQTGAS